MLYEQNLVATSEIFYHRKIRRFLLLSSYLINVKPNVKGQGKKEILLFLKLGFRT